MILQAISIGEAVPQADFDAAVHSVFREAINLRLIPDGTLLTAVASGEADLPQGIRIDTPVDFSFETSPAGPRVTCRGETLYLGSVSISLRGARRWKCDLPALRADLAKPAVSGAWRSVWQTLSRRQTESSADIVVASLLGSDQTPRSSVAVRAGKAVSGLLRATRRRDLREAAASVRGLIGLGHGLTPSGDDVLVGYLAGIWSGVREETGREEFVGSLGQATVAASTETNEISRACLWHAACGQVSSRLADLADAICNGMESPVLLQRAAAAMKVGHTSGMDAVTGLLLGLAAWEQGSIAELEVVQ